MNTRWLCALALLLLPTHGYADEQDARRTLEALGEFDARATGTHELGVYLRTKNLGRVTVRTERAPTDSGAAYRQVQRSRLSLGARKITTEGVALLDARLGLVRSTMTVTEVNAKETLTFVTKTFREGKLLVRTWSDGTKTQRFEIAASHADHGASSYELVRVLRSKGTYKLWQVKWPNPHKGESKVTWARLILRAEAAHKIKHRGKVVSARKIHLLVGADDPKPGELIVGAAGALLEMGNPGAPLRMVAGTAAEVQQDLPAAGR